MENSSTHKHDCVALMKKVILLLDGEMNEQEEKDFMKSICECAHCFESLEIERSFKECICNGIKRKELSAEVLISLREKIKIQIQS